MQFSYRICGGKLKLWKRMDKVMDEPAAAGIQNKWPGELVVTGADPYRITA
jgi:hypothetical protein